ncbi:RecJ-like exonuclease [Halovenus aranensis]|uniref:RecJ-like exonuclease n=1 Tax=Halovenus aranensis TaxID=890420 RepID=A0A1G8U659_9EURY|nr:OB-fold nucleic acid binding domain-containing protein [Halovenus aranensis]SDJ48615.1 RecJ-like exonuclease [Halovenus aranensis]
MSTPNGTGDDGTDFADSDEPTTVYDLAAGCTLDDIDSGEKYVGTVNGVVEYGVFVDLSESVSGLVHSSNLIGSYDVGDEVIVELAEVRPDGDVSFTEVQLADYVREQVGPGQEVTGETLPDAVGDEVHLDGKVVQIKQTGGPTIFQVRTASAVVPCAAFEEAGVRAYPDIELDDVVRISGTAETREGYTQIEVDSIATLDGEARETVTERFEKAGPATPADVEPLIDWPAFEKLRGDLQTVAARLRETVLEGRPIRMRHHADGDGLCASVPLQYALEQFIEATWEDPEAPRHLLKRLPSKAPFYELEDVTRDLNFALENRKRHGQKLPLFLMLDNGSTEEDTPAYRNLTHYDVPILVVDHHHPDPEAVEGLVEKHVNPYLYDEDYRITTGMMSVEIARMIAPDVTDDLRHVPAVAGLADRSDADAMDEYLALASEEGYDKHRLVDIGEALDYATYWLKYNDGRELVNDLLNVNCDDTERHERLVDLFTERAERDVETQLDAALEHVTREELDNGAHLYRIDVESHARRFTYPAPGKTTGKIHDKKVEETGDPVITIGYGPDFAVLRSDGVRLDIPEMVAELQAEVPGGGVSGGGHLVVGSIKFVSGMREAVVDALVEKMADAEIDEDLGSSAVISE